MPMLDFMCISPLYSSLACICMINSSDSIWDKINHAHSTSLYIFISVYMHTYTPPPTPPPHMDGFSFNSSTGKK